MVLRYKYQPDKRSATYMKNVLIVTPVRLELTARGLKVRCSKPTELRGCVFITLYFRSIRNLLLA